MAIISRFECVFGQADICFFMIDVLAGYSCLVYDAGSKTLVF